MKYSDHLILTKRVNWYIIEVDVRCSDEISQVETFFPSSKDIDDLRPGAGIAVVVSVLRFSVTE